MKNTTKIKLEDLKKQLWFHTEMGNSGMKEVTEMKIKTLKNHTK